MTTLADWLLVQIGVDEDVAREVAPDYERDRKTHWTDPGPEDWGFYANAADSSGRPIVAVGFSRVLAECAAKRAVIKRVCDVKWSGSFAVRDVVLQLMAQPYASRPGWRDEWGTT